MANAGMTKEKANSLIESGIADLVSFGLYSWLTRICREDSNWMLH